MALQRPTTVVDLKGGSTVVFKPSDLFGEEFLQLCEYLSGEVWEDGQARRTSTLTVFCEGGLVKVCLSDRALNRNVFASAQTLGVCLLEIETALVTGRCDWRSASRQDGGGKRKG